jgi:hypothetical protein
VPRVKPRYPSALKVPVRVEEFKGTEEQARDHVVSLNVMRRHLTVAQRGLIVRQLYLPQARVEARERLRLSQGQGVKVAQNCATLTETAKATEIAAQRSSGLANIRTIELMKPVDEAPRTQERIRTGEIKTATQARREALKEVGNNEPKDVPKQKPQSAYRALGHALRWAGEACESLERGEPGGVSPADIRTRIAAIHARLDQAERLVGDD